MSKPSELIPEMIRDWSVIAAQALVERLGIEAVVAEELGTEIAMSISNEYAGQNIYMPACAAYKASQRDRAIWAEYNAGGTRNVEYLVKKYGLSYVHILRICARMRHIERVERQADLFPIPGAKAPL